MSSHILGAAIHFLQMRSERPAHQHSVIDKVHKRIHNLEDEWQIHYIRDVVLQQIVLAAVSDLSDFVRCYESVFFVLLAKPR